MKAIVITKPGGPDVLELQDYSTPEISRDEVLIEVKAAGLNRSDVFQRERNILHLKELPPKFQEATIYLNVPSFVFL